MHVKSGVIVVYGRVGAVRYYMISYMIFSEMVPDEVKRELLERIRSYFGDNIWIRRTTVFLNIFFLSSSRYSILWLLYTNCDHNCDPVKTRHVLNIARSYFLYKGR